MAGENLYTALQGLNYTPAETIWGTGTQVIGQAVPQMINPYGSVGSNLGIALGGALLQSLGAYQARKEATDLSMQSNRLGLQLLRATTPEERLKVVEDVPTSFMSSDVQNKLLGLNAQLLAREDTARNAIENAVAADIGKQKALAEFYLTPEGEKIQEDTLERLRAESLARGAGLTERSKEIQEAIAARQENKQKFDEKMAYIKDSLSEAQKRNLLSAPEIEEVRLQTQLGSDLLSVTKQLEDLNIVEIKLMIETGISPKGHPGLVQKIEQLKQQYRKPEFGATLTGYEFNVSQKVFGDNIAADKNDILNAFKSLADSRFKKAENVIKAKQADLPTLYRSIQEARSGAGFILPEPQTKQEMLEKTGISSPSAPPANKDEGRSFLLEMKGKYGADWKAKMKPEEKKRAAEIIKAAKGQ